MFGYVIRRSLLCAIITWAWGVVVADITPDNLVYVNGFFAAEITVLTILLFVGMFWRMLRWIAWKFTYDVKFWDGPTITFEGNERKFIPIDVVGWWTQDQRQRYGDTFSDEDREMYWSTYSEEIDASNEQARRDYEEWVASGGPEREAAYEEKRRAKKAEKAANRASSYPSSWSNPTPQHQSTPQRQTQKPQTYPVRTPTPYKQPEKYRVQEMRPGMSKYTNRTGGTDLMNAQRQLEGVKNQRSTTSGAEKIKYRIVDKDGKVQ